MEAVLQYVTAPQFLPVVFGFISCLISGTLALGEGVIFMLLYEISRSYGLFGLNTSRLQGVLFSLLISVFSQLPIIFAGRYEMSTVLGYGVCMALVSLSFITMGVGMLVSGDEEVLVYAAAGFMVFSFFQLLKATLEFGEQRSNGRSVMSPRYPQIVLDSTGTAVISMQPRASVFSVRQEHLVSQLILGLRLQPSSLSVLHDVSPAVNVDLCHRILINIVFPDDSTTITDKCFSECIASLVSAETCSCSDMTTLLREDSLALKLMGAYCRRQHSQSKIGQILDPIFEAIVCDLSVADAANSSQMRELHTALNKIIPEVCSHMHDLPLGVRQSAAALVQSLLTRQHYRNQPLTLASAVGSLVFLRCVVPYTVEYGLKHANVQKFFVDVSSALQKISNGAEFPPSHRLFELNTVVKTLSPTLHTSFMSSFSTNSAYSVEFLPSCSSSSDAQFVLKNSINCIKSAGDMRCFVHLLAASASARAASGCTLAAELDTSITQLDSELWRAKHSEAEVHEPTNIESEHSSGIPHWEQVGWLLRRNPTFAAAYEHFFPNISESGAPIETIIIMLLIGKQTVCKLITTRSSHIHTASAASFSPSISHAFLRHCSIGHLRYRSRCRRPSPHHSLSLA